MKFFVKLLILFSIIVILSILIFSVLSVVKFDKVSLSQRLQSKYNVFEPGGWGQTLRRFRDIDNYKNIDILFAGSSHAYRGFDPRIFANSGIKSFNSGTTSQTPLNTYFIIKEHIEKLSPRIIILELYPEVLTVDGFESFIDIAKNTTFSFELLQMALSLKSLNALKALLEISINQIDQPLKTVKQKVIEGETYIEGGYCESDIVRDKDDPSPEVKEIVPLAKQLEYVKKIINLSKKYDSEVLVVIHPLPKDHLKSIVNYDRLSLKLKKIVTKYGAVFVDFNKILPLNSYSCFKDDDHLNSIGVEKFNKELVKHLRSNQKYNNLFTVPDFDNKTVTHEKL